MSGTGKCKVCEKEFQRTYTTTQPVCSIECAIELARQKRERKHKRETTRMRSKFNRNDRTFMTKKATRACHKYIRLRDAGKGCISCGTLSGKMQAGHWKSVGARPALRFHHWNINLQCVRCNMHKSGNQADYRVGLVKKIGEAAVQYLEIDHPPQKYTLEDLQGVADWFTDLARNLQKTD